MKYLLSYKIFESTLQSESNKLITDVEQSVQNEIEDILINVRDSGLEVSDIYKAQSISMGDSKVKGAIQNNIIYPSLDPGRFWRDHRSLSLNSSYPSITIRLRMVKGGSDERPYFSFKQELFDELEPSIKHLESHFNLKFRCLFINQQGGLWCDSIETLKDYIDNLPFAKKSSLKWITYLDLTFEIL
jgi:hypothetical protein